MRVENDLSDPMCRMPFFTSVVISGRILSSASTVRDGEPPLRPGAAPDFVYRF